MVTPNNCGNVVADFWFERVVIYPRSRIISLFKRNPSDGLIERYELDRTCLELPSSVKSIKKPTRLDEVQLKVIGIEAIKTLRKSGGY